MTSFIVFLSLLAVHCLFVHGNGDPQHLQLVTEPPVLIPGLTQKLNLVCGPGTLASLYREIFIIQLLRNSGGNQHAIATLLLDQAPTLGISDPRVTVTGHLISGNSGGNSSGSSSLNVSIAMPTSQDAGEVICKVVGLGSTGNEESNTDKLNITVHAESDKVDSSLKMIVANLQKETERLLAYAQSLKAENQRLSSLATAKQTAVAQKKADLQSLKSELQTLKQTMEDYKDTLNRTALDLIKDIADISQDAPPMRVSFNAQEKTERVYTSGQQIKFDTVDMNVGNGYVNTTSKFIPPVAGVYYFTTSQLAHGLVGAAYRSYSIRVNNTVVGSAMNTDNHQSTTFKQSSTSTIIRLSPYDIVTVYQQYSSADTALTAYSNTANGVSTNFAGYLIY